MTITTTQVTAEDALRAVADGKQVQMVWTNSGEPMFLNFNQKIASIMQSGDAFLIVEVAEDEPEKKEYVEPTIEEVPETVCTDPDLTPITVKIPNSHKAERARRSKLDDEMIVKLKKDGMSEFKIAIELESSQPTIHKHVERLKKEGRL